jgi:hypothetical protein
MHAPNLHAVWGRPDYQKVQLMRADEPPTYLAGSNPGPEILCRIQRTASQTLDSQWCE